MAIVDVTGRIMVSLNNRNPDSLTDSTRKYPRNGDVIDVRGKSTILVYGFFSNGIVEIFFRGAPKTTIMYGENFPIPIPNFCEGFVFALRDFEDGKIAGFDFELV